MSALISILPNYSSSHTYTHTKTKTTKHCVVLSKQVKVVKGKSNNTNYKQRDISCSSTHLSSVYVKNPRKNQTTEVIISPGRLQKVVIGPGGRITKPSGQFQFNRLNRYTITRCNSFSIVQKTLSTQLFIMGNNFEYITKGGCTEKRSKGALYNAAI